MSAIHYMLAANYRARRMWVFADLHTMRARICEQLEERRRHG